MINNLNYFDLHCDTLTKMYDKSQTLDDNSCMINRESISMFEKYGQVYAVFSRPELDNDACYRRFFDCVSSFEKKEGSFCKTKNDLTEAYKSGSSINILSIEDLRLTSCDANKLLNLLNAGVCIVTPLWSGETCIGGAFDTDKGLTDLGWAMTEICLSENIILDISHASKQSANDIFSLAEINASPVIASHSNSFTICPHPRNLTDRQALRIKELGGIVGVNLVPEHLSNDIATSEDVVRHIDYLLNIVGEDYVALGCDFDGIKLTPADIKNQSQICNLINQLKKHGIDGKLLDKILFENVYNFLQKNIREK